MPVIALNKFLPLLVLPLAASLLLLSAGLRFNQKVLAVAGLLILGLLGTPAIGDMLLGSLENRYAYVPLDSCPKADAVFVFGGMLGLRDCVGGGIAWNEAAERFDRAVRIMRSDRANVLVLSGGAELYPGGENEGQLLATEAQERNVPPEKIIVTESTQNTAAEARALCKLLERHQWKRVLVVTSAFHMPRAMDLCRDYSSRLIAVPVAFETPSPSTGWAYRRPEYYIPQAKGLFRSELALREYLGLYLFTSHL